MNKVFNVGDTVKFIVPDTDKRKFDAEVHEGAVGTIESVGYRDDSLCVNFHNNVDREWFEWVGMEEVELVASIQPKPLYEIKEVYSVYTTIDEYDRRGRLVGYFSDKTEADRRAQGQGWYGGKGDVTKVYVITIDGISFALQSKEIIKLNEVYGDEYYKKQNALAKLTDEEKKLLGLE